MATYNGVKHIKEQLDSILNQDLSAFPNAELEIIISDDGSTDGTLNIIKGYTDPRITIIRHTQERKHHYHTALYAATENFGYAMTHATGDYIFLSDQDDIWYPNKISESLHVLTEKGGVVATAFDLINEKGITTGEVKYKYEPFWQLKKHHTAYGFSIGIERSELRYMLPIPSQIPQHDVFIHHMAQWRKRLFFINKKLAAHRWTEKNNTSNSANSIPLSIKLYSKFCMFAIVIYRNLVK